MMGFFGGSKATKKSESPAPPPPVTETAPSSAAAADEGDLFGGLAVAKPRRARKAKGEVAATTEDTPAVVEPSPAPEPAVASSASPSGLSRSKKKAAVATAKAYKGSESAEKALLRARIQRFYQEYRPEKLSSIDIALSTYIGREAEMFKALEAKYGPEPTGPLALPEGHPYLAEHPEEPTTEEPQQQLPADDGWGATADTQQANDEAPGWGSGEADWGVAASEVEEGGFPAEDAGFGGGGGWGDTAAPENVGFSDAGFGDAPVEDEVPPFQADEEEKPAQEEDVAAIDSTKSTPVYSDAEDETLNERHRRELSTAKSNLGESEHRLSDLLRSVGEGIAARRDALEEFESMDVRIDDLVHKEKFEEAEELNATLPALAEAILQRDRATAKALNTGKDAHVHLLDAVKALADVYNTQEEELYRNQREEERRTTNYLMETTSRIEQLSEKVKADLDRASRALSHSEQEFQNLQTRQQKTQTKIEEQTRTLRVQREKNEIVRSSLATEIKDLEAKLVAKRKKLSEADAELSAIDEKMNIIKDEYSITLHDVGRMVDEERGRMEGHKRDVETLATQEQQAKEEELNFAEEKSQMTFQMQTYSSRIQCYKTLAEDLTTRQFDVISRFYEGTIRRAFHSRGKGTNFLVPVPQAVIDNAGDASHAGDNESSSSGGSAQSGGGVNSGVDALKRKEHDLLKARSTISTMDAQIAATLLSLQNIESQLPLLEAAKKAAAQTKQFKEAKAKAEEIIAATKEREELEAALVDMRRRKDEAEADVVVLVEQVADEKKAAKERVAHFAEAYAETLAECQVAADTPLLITALVNLDESQAVAEFVEKADLTNGSVTSADATHPPPTTVKDVDALYKAGQPHDLVCEFVEATKACLAALEGELLAVYPEAASTLSRIRSSLATNPQPLPPIVEEEANDDDTPVEEEDAPHSRTHSDVGLPPAADEWGSVDPTAATDSWGTSAEPAAGGDEWGATAAADSFGGGAFEDAQEEEVPVQFDLEAVKQQLSELEARLEEAMSIDDYDACETLQEQIDELTAKIEANAQ